MKTVPVLLLGALALTGGMPAAAETPDDPDHDFLFLDLESYPAFRNNAPENGSGVDLGRVAGQLAFPAGELMDHSLYGVFKSTYFDREIAHAGQVLSAGPLQRYWLAGGISLVDTPRRSSSFMLGLGLNSDMAEISPFDLNTEWIYTYSFLDNPRFKWGLGFSVQQYFHKFMPYPLIFVDWKLTENTKFRWDADFLEIRRFLGQAFSLALGVRFNLEFFALKEDAAFEYNSVGVETGLQYSLGGHCYVRLKYKELVGGREIITLPDGSEHEHKIASGRSLRLNFAYGI